MTKAKNNKTGELMFSKEELETLAYRALAGAAAAWFGAHWDSDPRAKTNADDKLSEAILLLMGIVKDRAVEADGDPAWLDVMENAIRSFPAARERADEVFRAYPLRGG